MEMNKVLIAHFPMKTFNQGFDEILYFSRGAGFVSLNVQRVGRRIVTLHNEEGRGDVDGSSWFER